MKLLVSSFERLAKAPGLRPDFRLQSFLTEVFPFETRPLGESVISLYNGANIGPDSYAGHLETGLIYPTVNNLKPYGLELGEVTFLEDATDANPRLEDDDLVLGRSGTVGISKAWDKGEVNRLVGKAVESVPSGYLIVVKLDAEKVRPRFAEYYLQTPRMRRYFDVFGVGKSQKNISQPDVLRIPFPVVATRVQDETLDRIRPIDDEVRALRGRVYDQAGVINQVFAEEFAFDVAEFARLSNRRVFSARLTALVGNVDLRCSPKFHRDAAHFVKEELYSRSKKRLKDYLSEDIVLGATIAPSDYDDAGETFYVAMSSIKSWSLDEEAAHTTSDAFAKRNAAKRVRKDDIIMARSGEGTIGKVAVMPDGIDGVHADFTMRIRVRPEDYQTPFAYYFFRSAYFQYLIEVEKKGLGNNTNIFPVQLREFPMLDADAGTQHRVVDAIGKKFAEQAVVKEQIAGKRQEIARLVEAALA